MSYEREGYEREKKRDKYHKFNFRCGVAFFRLLSDIGYQISKRKREEEETHAVGSGQDAHRSFLLTHTKPLVNITTPTHSATLE